MTSARHSRGNPRKQPQPQRASRTSATAVQRAAAPATHAAPAIAQRLLPLGAMAAGFGLLAASAMVQAQTTSVPAAPAAAASAPRLAPEATLVSAPVRARVETDATSVRANTTTIGKGKQDIRDIPQALTVITEKVMDDRKLDNVKDVLRNTSGITFQAAEGGEEDIKLHGISLQSTGDIFIDGMRDPAFYERDTFFLDRIELLRGSASLLFGRGSTGGAVNQSTKQALLANQNQIDASLGSHGAVRTVGDFNVRLGETSAVRVGLMGNVADSNGAGSKIDKHGLGASYRWGIDETDEIGVTLYTLQNDNGINYGVRFIRPTTTSPVADTTLLPVDPNNYYGLSSDYNQGSLTYGMLTHTHRFSSDTEVVTKVRSARYTRDQRATLWNFGGAATQPGGQAVSLATLSPSTVLTRGQQLKKQDMQTVLAQSDLSSRFKTFGLDNYLQAGVDFADEKKQVFGQVSAAQGGVVPTRPNTTIGTPFDGASIDESLRSYRRTNDYTSRAYGGYVQDMIQIVPTVKVVAGLRYDRLDGDYNAYAVPTTALTPVTTTSYQMKVSEWSKRAAVLYQPTEQLSFHLMGATSFNTSGDAYSLSAANANIPPEKSVNYELGAKLDSFGGKLSTRVGIFRNTKLHERNTDPLVNLVTLSGKRHAAGVDIDVVGRITSQWEVFGNFTWMPVAKIDVAAPGAEGQGARPSMTPQYSGTLWTTYQFLPQLRLGGGLNGRSANQPFRNPGFYVPKFLTGDLMAEYLATDDLSFRLNVSNLTNKRYADQLYTSFYVPGAGRVVTLTGSYKF